MNCKVNCQYFIKNGYCNNEKIKKPLLFARTCTEYGKLSGTECSHFISTPRPILPPPMYGLKSKFN